MARFLLDYCINNRTDLCDPRVSYSRWPKCLERPDDIPTFPEGKAQEMLDRLCETCAHACFIVKTRCPVCRCNKMVLAEPSKIVLYNRLGPLDAYRYICEKCGRDLFRRIGPAN